MNSNPLLTIEPELIFFERCEQNSKVVIFKLTNITAHIVIWRVKMTAPSRYKMEPKRGIIQPLETEKIEVRIQYNKYPVNMPGNDKRERDSNGVFVDRFQFESIILDCEPHVRSKSWWKDSFDKKEACLFKSKVFFTKNDVIPQHDIDFLINLMNQPKETTEHVLESSGFLELSTSSLLDLHSSQNNNNNNNQQQEQKRVDSKIEEQPKIVLDSNEKNVQLSPRKEIEKPIQIDNIEMTTTKPELKQQRESLPQSLSHSSNLSYQKNNSPTQKHPTTPLQSPQKLNISSPSQQQQQPILRPPEKTPSTSSPLSLSSNSTPQKGATTTTSNNSSPLSISSNSTPQKGSTITTATSNTTTPSLSSFSTPQKGSTTTTTSTQSISSTSPVKELQRNHTSVKIKEESSVIKLIFEFVKNLIWANIYFIIAFLCGFYARHHYG